MDVAVRSKFFVLLVITLGLAPAASAQTHRTTFTNATPNAVPGTGTEGPAAAYPSNIVVSGVAGVAYHVSVTLNLTHTFAADLDLLLVAPSGRGVLLMSGVAAGGDLASTAITIDDCAPRAFRGNTGTILAGRYQPSTFPFPHALPAPAPESPYGNGLSTFNFTGANGTWQLYAFDNAGFDVGSVNSWSLTFFDQPSSPSPASGALNPAPCAAPDYDGDGRTDVAVYRPTTGQWFISQSGSSGSPAVASWGAPSSSGLGDIQVPADYDADGITDLAVYRQSSGEWFARRSFDLSVLAIPFGAPSSTGLGDTPVPGDYDGDGLADLAIFRTSTGQWFLRGGTGVTTVTWGGAGDVPARR